MNSASFTFLILMTLLFSSCDFSDHKLVVINNSKDSIAFIIPAEPNYFPTSDINDNQKLNKHINDSLLNTIFKFEPARESFGGVHFIGGDTFKNILAFNTHWEDIINETTDKKLKIIFFPSNVMTSGKYTWKEIYKNKLFTSQKELSLSEIEIIDWKITCE